MIGKDAWNDFNFFEFTKARFMAQDVIYLGEGSMCTQEKGEIHFWGEMSYILEKVMAPHSSTLAWKIP